MAANDPYMIETPIVDTLIEIEWSGMVEAGKSDD